MKTDADELTEHESVAAIRKHVGWLVRDQVLTPHAAIELQRAFEAAIAESRADRLAVVAVVDALLHGLDKGTLSTELFEIDPERQVVLFRLAPTTVELVSAGLIERAVWERLRRLLKIVETWLPDAGINGVQRRVHFGGQQSRGFEFDLAKARSFLKRIEAVPSRGANPRF